jgi:hypothetical protein
MGDHSFEESCGYKSSTEINKWGRADRQFYGREAIISMLQKVVF